MQLLIYWVICSAIAVVAVVLQVSGNKKASTIVRKIFHLLAVSVFVPGLIYRPCLLYLASGIVLGIFIALEVSFFFYLFKLSHLIVYYLCI